ncbi:MAG: SDR family NAD(P)-dependent oxidoreductase [Ferruginibacter sp.]
MGTILNNEASVFAFPESQFEKVVVDLSDEAGSKKFVEGVVEKYGSVDAAILTVGGFAMGNISATSTADIMRQYKLNFETAYNIIRPVFVQMMKQNTGRIFMIGAKPGLDAKLSKGMVAYGLAKSLILRLAELMNDEAKGTNVVITVVVPGTIDTMVNRKAMPDADFSKWVNAEDIANIIHYHSTDAAAALKEPVLKVYSNS